LENLRRNIYKGMANSICMDGFRRSRPVLAVGLCLRGFYRFGESILRNPDVYLINWGNSRECISQEVLQEIRLEKTRSNTSVIFASWSKDVYKKGLDEKSGLLRKGVIDHMICREARVEFTIFPEGLLIDSIEIPEKDHYLFRYSDQSLGVRHR
jgi:hypothetical protein